ncbi:MAG: N-acetylmuramoyl-L-alanine amidase [Eubacteriales bacterium]
MKRIVLFDAGHNRKAGDPGAVSGKFIEADINVAVAKAAGMYLTAHYNCEAIVDTVSTIPQNCRTAKAKQAGAAISIHHNAGGGDGCEVYYAPSDPEAKQLATLIVAEFKAIGQNAHGIPVKSSSKFGFCRINAENGIPAVLGEFAFVDNAKDRLAIDSSADMLKEGAAYAKAVAKFLQLPIKV